jgi:hypothetical protein
MKENRAQNNWIIDAVLFSGFVVMFFMNLTGVALHQWIGVAAGVLALFHLAVHWDWVEAVSKRFLGRSSGQARLYYLVDIGILLGMASILVSGLAISTWLSLPLGSAWAEFLETGSIVTLLLLGFKIAIHWRWIVKTARRMVPPADVPAAGRLAFQPVAASATMYRRDFLKLMGVVGAATGLALINVAGSSGEGSAQVSETQTESATNTQTTSTGQNSNLFCSTRCRKGRSCTYPGECHDYRDSNGNGVCENGECV